MLDEFLAEIYPSAPSSLPNTSMSWANTCRHAGRYTPFEIAALRSSTAASRSGWNGCCNKDPSREVENDKTCNRSHTYDIYDAPLLLPARAFRRRSRLAFSSSLLFICQKRNGNVLRSLGFRLRMVITVINHVGVVAWSRDGFRRRKSGLLRLWFPMRFLLE